MSFELSMLLAAFAGDSSRLFMIHGDTYVDPPAGAIMLMATVIVIATLLFT